MQKTFKITLEDFSQDNEPFDVETIKEYLNDYLLDGNLKIIKIEEV